MGSHWKVLGQKVPVGSMFEKGNSSYVRNYREKRVKMGDQLGGYCSSADRDDGTGKGHGR